MFGFIKRKKSLGVALGGGAFRCWAHLGALKILEEENIPIDYLSGTSIGAIIAGFCAQGYSTNYIYEKLKNISLFQIVELDFSWKAMLSMKKIEKILRQELGTITIGQTKIPLRILATEFKTGQAYVFKDPNVDLVSALCASSSIPAVFSPYKYLNKYFVDGCLTNNLPVNQLKSMGADFVLGIDLNPKSLSKEAKDFQTIFTWANDIYDNSRMGEYRRFADMIVSPLKEYVGTFYFSDKLEKKLYQAGQSAMKKQLPRLKKSLRI